MGSKRQHGELLTTRDVAAFFGVSTWTVRAWRSSGRGPAYIKIAPLKGNGVVRYRQRDLEKFVEKHLVKAGR